MNIELREYTKKRILERYELYKLQHSRIRRFLKDPLHTLPFYILVYFAYKHPFKISYKTFWGDVIRFYLPEGSAIYYYGFFEANLTNFLLNFLKEDTIFFDVGAHVGYYTVLASSLVGKTGSVHSFEPTFRTFNTLKENTSKKENVTINNNAVLDHETEIEFIDYGPKYSAFNSFQERKGKSMTFLPSPEKMKIKTISLDEYCYRKEVFPDLIKIDAEGAEHLILQAMNKLLSDKKPLVTIEVAGEDEWKDNCKKSIEILESYGYMSFEFTLEGNIQRHKQRDTYAYDNLLFVHPERISEVEHLLVTV